ncbi:hypothetical protein [Dyella sp.]|uniref:hypothetical protein n=1 Tax=Dyella sp. TaxID=1869338 RepID=UPI002ED2F3FF
MDKTRTVALALLLGWAAQAHAQQVHVDALKGHQGEDDYAFPVVKGGDRQAMQRINTWLQAVVLHKMPGHYRKNLVEDVWADHAPDDISGFDQLDFSVNAAAPGYVSISLTGEYVSASLNSYAQSYNFDARTGQLIDLYDLFSERGLARFTADVAKARVGVLNDHLAELKAKPDQVHGGDEAAPADLERIYERCRNEVRKDGLDRDKLTLSNDKLGVSRDCTVGRMEESMDDLGELDHEVAFSEIASMLSDYGRCLLVNRRTDCINPNKLMTAGVLYGSIDGRLPITLVWGSHGDDGYFYDRVNKFIHLSFSGEPDKNGNYVFHEYADNGLPAKFVLTRLPDGGFKGTWTQTAGKPLPVELHR